MYKKIRFLVKSILNNIIMFIVGLFIRRDNKILVLGNKKLGIEPKRTQLEHFLHNTKYLFLYLNEIPQSDFRVIYLCDDKKMIKIFKSMGYNDVYTRNSLKGIYYILKAKYWLYDQGKSSIHSPVLSLSDKAVCINLWHGVPLKYIGYDFHTRFNNLSPFQKSVFNFFREKDDYYVVNGEYEKDRFKSAFWTGDDSIKILGSPRLDVLFHDFKDQHIFIEEDYTNIKRFKEQGKKVLIYMPTFRDTDKDISSWLKSDKLKEFLNQNNAVLVCKLHSGDKNLLNFEISEGFYKMNSASDIYPILKYSDFLITDYSSINFDYLLLDKPILYYVPDLEEYQKQCREFYTSYNNYAVGDVAQNEDELLQAMGNALNGVDNYKEQRKMLRDKMFVYQDGKNCERVVEWIKSLG